MQPQHWCFFLDFWLFRNYYQLVSIYTFNNFTSDNIHNYYKIALNQFYNTIFQALLISIKLDIVFLKFYWAIPFMFNFISHRAGILVSLELRFWFFCESRHQPDVKSLTAISFPGYLTRQYLSYYSSFS